MNGSRRADLARRLCTSCFVVVTALGAQACASDRRAPGPPPPQRAAQQQPAQPAAGTDEPLFEGLGTFSRPVTTSSSLAQRYFDQGLAFLYAFNHDEAIRSFQKASELDSKCAMAEWGIAMANGPHINYPAVPPERARAAWEALGRARERLAYGATDVERALIDALGKRYAWPQPEDRGPLDQAYAAAMRDVWRAYPNDPDVGALFAEAVMDLRPWNLWTDDGKPQPGTEEILATLEAVLAKAPNHPLANHLYIHAVEASPTPGKATISAERLRTLQPGLGHMVHMPSHIDVRLGRWQEAIASNTNAIEADRAYREKRTKQDFYRLYMAHNHHMLTFAAMMTGQGELATKTIREMVAGIPSDWLRENASFADGFAAMPYEVLMRFGKWDEILAEPEPPEYLPFSRTLRHYARGVAFAAEGKLPEARAEQAAMRSAKAKIPEDATFGNNEVSDLVAIADNLLTGEILFREGKKSEGIAKMREAAAREDRLRYDEPPDWIQPIRHALGAALVRANKPKDAEAVYREDLARLPENVWSLHGLARSLRMQKRDAEAAAVEARLEAASKNADIALTSSCMCLPGI